MNILEKLSVFYRKRKVFIYSDSETPNVANLIILNLIVAVVMLHEAVVMLQCRVCMYVHT